MSIKVVVWDLDKTLFSERKGKAPWYVNRDYILSQIKALFETLTADGSQAYLGVVTAKFQVDSLVLEMVKEFNSLFFSTATESHKVNINKHFDNHIQKTNKSAAVTAFGADTLPLPLMTSETTFLINHPRYPRFNLEYKKDTSLCSSFYISGYKKENTRENRQQAPWHKVKCLLEMSQNIHAYHNKNIEMIFIDDSKSNIQAINIYNKSKKKLDYLKLSSYTADWWRDSEDTVIQTKMQCCFDHITQFFFPVIRKTSPAAGTEARLGLMHNAANTAGTKRPRLTIKIPPQGHPSSQSTVPALKRLKKDDQGRSSTLFKQASSAGSPEQASFSTSNRIK